MTVTCGMRNDLLQPLRQQRPIGQASQDIVLGKLVRLRRRHLELLGPLRNLVLQRSLIAGDLGLRFGESLGHVVERVREQSQLVAGFGRHVDVEFAGADCAGGTHELAHRRDQAPREQ